MNLMENKMYCVICLHNRARDFFCPYCMPKVKVLFKDNQLSVTNENRKDFESLSIKQQWAVIFLTNKRLGKILKAEIRNGYLETQRKSVLMLEFKLDNYIKEYSEMSVMGHPKLDIPIREENDDILRRSYSQYKPPKGDLL